MGGRHGHRQQLVARIPVALCLRALRRGMASALRHATAPPTSEERCSTANTHDELPRELREAEMKRATTLADVSILYLYLFASISLAGALLLWIALCLVGVVVAVGIFLFAGYLLDERNVFSFTDVPFLGTLTPWLDLTFTRRAERFFLPKWFGLDLGRRGTSRSTAS